MKMLATTFCLAALLIITGSLWAWEENGTPVTTTSGGQESPRVVPASQGRFYVVWVSRWQAGTGVPVQVQARLYDGGGRPLWSSALPVSAPYDQQADPWSVRTTSDALLVSFAVPTAYPLEAICVSKLSAQGERLWTTRVSADVSQRAQSASQLCIDAGGEGCYVAWQDQKIEPFSNWKTWVARLNGQGQVLWEVQACTSQGLHWRPTLVPSGDGCMVFWMFERMTPETTFAIYGQRIRADGTLCWGENGRVVIPDALWPTQAFSPQLQTDEGTRQPYAFEDGEEGAVVCGLLGDEGGYQHWYHGYQRVDSLGNLLWIPPVAAMPYCAASDEAGGVVCALRDVRVYPEQDRQKLQVVRVGSGGQAVWGESLLVWEDSVRDTGTFFLWPTVTGDSSQGLVAAWVRDNYQTRELLVGRVSQGGGIAWNPPTVMCRHAFGKEHPAIARAAGGYVIAWEDGRGGNWDDRDVYMSWVDSTGHLGVQEDEIGSNYPAVCEIRPVGGNPRRFPVMLEYVLNRRERVRLEMLDVLGRRIWERDCGVAGSGSGNSVWEGRGCPPGIYFARLTAGTRSATAKLVMLE